MKNKFFNKSVNLTIIITIFILIAGCSLKKRPSPNRNQKIENNANNKGIEEKATESIKEKNKDSGALATVKSYLEMVISNETEKANTFIISKEYIFNTKEGGSLTISPNKNNPFSYIKIKSIDEVKSSVSNHQVEVYTYTIVADTKWTGKDSLIEDYAFFTSALKENGKWKVSGINTEF